MDSSVVHAVFERFVNHISAFHVSPVLDLISTLNWFDLASLTYETLSTFGEMKMQRSDTSGNIVVTCFSHLMYHEFFWKKYKENFTEAKFVFKLKSFEAKWQKLFLTIKYSFYLKFSLSIKLNVNILVLIESQLEININKY